MTGNLNLTAGNDIRPSANSTTAINIAQADGTDFVIFDTTNKKVTITSGSPSVSLAPTSDSLDIATDSSTVQRIIAASDTGATAPALNLLKARGTIASPTIVSSGDTLGAINFQGWSGTSRVNGARILSQVDATPGSSDMPGNLTFLTTPDGSITPAERMRITNAGFVGVGTTSPQEKLELKDGSFYLSDADVAHGMTDLYPTNVYGGVLPYNGTAGGLRIDGLSDSNATAFYFRGTVGDTTVTAPALVFAGAKKSGTAAQALSSTEPVFQFKNYATELMTILGSGNVGIGTTSPSTPLEIYNAAGNTDKEFLRLRTSGSSTGAGIQIKFVESTSTEVGRIYTMDEGSTARMTFSTYGAADTLTIKDGNVGIGTTSPTSSLHVVKQDEVAIYSDVYSNTNYSGGTVGRRARGTIASPAVVQSGDYISAIFGRGYTGAAFPSSSNGVIGILAAETFNAGATGTYITFETTPTGSTTRAERMRITAAGLVGIGTTAPSNSAMLDVASGVMSIVVGADNNVAVTRTNATNKSARVGAYHYTNAEEPVGIFLATSSSTANSVSFGGGSALFNTATQMSFYTAADTTTTTGTERLKIVSDGEIQILVDGTSGAAGCLSFGAGQDGQILHSGTIFSIQSDATTATDSLLLRGGTNGIDFNIGATEQITLTDGKLAPTTNNDIDLGDSTHKFKDGYFAGKLTVDGEIDPTAVDFLQITTPANPAANHNKIYFKSDDKLYKLTSAGVESEVGGGGGGGETLAQTLALGNTTGGYDIDFNASGDVIVGNSYTSIDPYGRTLHDSSGNETAGWSSGYLTIGSSGNAYISAGANGVMSLYSSDSVSGGSWEMLQLDANLGVKLVSDPFAANGQHIYLKDGTGSGGGNLYLDAGKLYWGTSGFYAADESGYVNFYSSSGLMFFYDSSALKIPSDKYLNMQGGELRFESGSKIKDGSNTSIDPYNRYLYDSSGLPTLDWDYNGDVTPLHTLDMGSANMKFTSGSYTITDGSATSIDPFNRQLLNSNATCTFDWNGSGTNIGLSIQTTGQARFYSELQDSSGDGWFLPSTRALTDASDNALISLADNVNAYLYYNSGDSRWHFTKDIDTTIQTIYADDIVMGSGALIKDGSNTSIDPYNRKLYAIDGTSVRYDWENNQIYDNAGTPRLSIDPNARKIYSYDGTVLIDYSNQYFATMPELAVGYIHDSTWAPKIQLDPSYLGAWGAGFVPALDWASRILYASDGTTAVIDWTNTLNALVPLSFSSNDIVISSNIDDTSNFKSIDPNNRKLYASDGSTAVLDWSSNYLISTPEVSTSYISTSSNIIKIDVNNSQFGLWGASFVPALDWASRILYASDGTTAILDWSTDGTAEFGDNNVETDGALTISGQSRVSSGGFTTTTNNAGVSSGGAITVHNSGTSGELATITIEEGIITAYTTVP
jgi:hypothetical protein